MKQTCFVRVVAIALLVGAGLSTARGQTAESSADFVRDAQILQSRLTIQSLTEEILAIDGEIERRVDKLVTMLAGVTDSVDSGRKIANQKEEVIEGLQRSIEWYRRERAKRQSDLTARYHRIPVEDLEAGIAVMDAKVERRIEQILAVSASLAGHQDVARYEQEYDRWDDSWDRRVSDEYRHNQRIADKTDRAREGIREDLEQDRDVLERRRDALRRRIAITSDPDTRQALTKQVERLDETIARRRGQKVGTYSGSSAVAGRTVSSREATSLERLMRDMVSEIQHDFRRLEGLVNQLYVERQRLQQLSAW